MAPEERLVRPKLKPLRLLVSWLVAAASLFVAAGIVPHVEVKSFLGALVTSLVIAILNALIPPLVAAVRLPFTLVLGFLLVLILDALMLLAASAVTDNAIEVDSFWWALLTALIASAVTVVLDVLFGTNDDDTYTLRVIERIARRSGERVDTEVPGLVFLEIDGLALPVLQRAMRDGNAPNMARWLADDGHRFVEWEPDLSSQTGREPGRDPPRLEREHPRVPLGREGDRHADDVLGARRLRRDRAAALDRGRAAGRRRREPREPPLGRGRARDPHGQPDGGREGGEPGLSRVLLERLQRHAGPRPLLLGALPRVDRGPASDPPRRSPDEGIAAASTRSCGRRCASSSAT